MSRDASRNAVEGAYVQPAGSAWPWGEATDLAYLRLARELHAAGAEVMLASHTRPCPREALLPGRP